MGATLSSLPGVPIQLIGPRRVAPESSLWPAMGQNDVFNTCPGQPGTKKNITKAQKYEDTKSWLFFFFALSVFRVFVISF